MKPMLIGALKSGSMRLADATDVGFAVLKPLPDASSGWFDAHLVGLRQVIAVGVDPRILDPARRRARVGVADVGADRRQLSGVAAEAGAQDASCGPRRARRSCRRAARCCST